MMLFWTQPRRIPYKKVLPSFPDNMSELKKVLVYVLCGCCILGIIHSVKAFADNIKLAPSYRRVKTSNVVFPHHLMITRSELLGITTNAVFSLVLL